MGHAASHAVAAVQSATKSVVRSVHIDHGPRITGQRIGQGLLAAAAFPLTAQNFTAGLIGGEGVRGAAASTNQFWSDPGKYFSNPRNLKGQATIGAAVATAGAGAEIGAGIGQGAAGAATGSVLMPPAASAGSGALVGAGIGATAGGGAGYAAGNLATHGMGGAPKPDMPAPVTPVDGGTAPSINNNYMQMTQNWAKSAGGTMFTTPYMFAGMNKRGPLSDLVGA